MQAYDRNEFEIMNVISIESDARRESNLCTNHSQAQLCIAHRLLRTEHPLAKRHDGVLGRQQRRAELLRCRQQLVRLSGRRVVGREF